MQLAANELLTGTDSVAVVAERVGYESEAAFSRAERAGTERPRALVLPWAPADETNRAEPKVREPT